MSYELKDYLNAINHEKTPLMDTEDEVWEKKYSPFIINKCLAPFPDTIHLVNEMNLHNHLDSKLQFDFFLNTVRTRKRYTPWMKASKTKNEKARSALKLLSDEQIKAIKSSLDKGGRNGKH